MCHFQTSAGQGVSWKGYSLQDGFWWMGPPLLIGREWNPLTTDIWGMFNKATLEVLGITEEVHSRLMNRERILEVRYQVLTNVTRLHVCGSDLRRGSWIRGHRFLTSNSRAQKLRENYARAVWKVTPEARGKWRLGFQKSDVRGSWKVTSEGAESDDIVFMKEMTDGSEKTDVRGCRKVTSEGPEKWHQRTLKSEARGISEVTFDASTSRTS